MTSMYGANWCISTLSFASLSLGRGERPYPESPEQQALLLQASRADPIALTALYDQYVKKIYGYVYHRVGQAELAEDLTAQVFTRMLEAIRSGRPWQSSFSGWLYRIAHNLVIDHYRRRNRASFVDLDTAPTMQANDGDPVNFVEFKLDSERLRAALNQLTEEQAQVIVLRFLEGLSITEVARSLSKSEGAIKALQYRAVLALRRQMEP